MTLETRPRPRNSRAFHSCWMLAGRRPKDGRQGKAFDRPVNALLRESAHFERLNLLRRPAYPPIRGEETGSRLSRQRPADPLRARPERARARDLRALLARCFVA